MSRFNDDTFLAGRNSCRGRSKRARYPQSPNPSNLFRTPGRSCANAVAQPTRPGSVLLVTAGSAPAAHWPLEGQLRRLRPSTSPGPSGRTVGTESLVLSGYLLPDCSPSTSEKHWYCRRFSGSGSAQAQFDSPVVRPAPVPIRSVNGSRSVRLGDVLPAPVLTGPAPIPGRLLLCPTRTRHLRLRLQPGLVW
jgi:hypothetical protein